jgi:hypothetical protein
MACSVCCSCRCCSVTDAHILLGRLMAFSYPPSLGKTVGRKELGPPLMPRHANLLEHSFYVGLIHDVPSYACLGPGVPVRWRAPLEPRQPVVGPVPADPVRQPHVARGRELVRVVQARRGHVDEVRVPVVVVGERRAAVASPVALYRTLPQRQPPALIFFPSNCPRAGLFPHRLSKATTVAGMAGRYSWA